MNKLIQEELYEIEELEGARIDDRFKVQDINSANWCFRKLKAIDEKEKEVEQLAKNEIERINAWKKEELEATEGSKNYFEGLLTEYYIKQREVDEKFKLSTPYGKVSSRKQQPKWNYEDEKVVDWLEENNEKLIRIKKEVDKAAFKKFYEINGSNVVTEDGEIVEGVMIEERADTVSINVVE